MFSGGRASSKAKVVVVGDAKPDALVIMRHAKGADRSQTATSIPFAELSDEGYSEASAVAARLAETLRNEGLAGTTTDVLILSPPDGPAAATAAIVAEAVRREFTDAGPQPEPIECRSLEELRAGGLQVGSDALIGLVDEADMPKVLLVVGHDPEMGSQLHVELATGLSWPQRRLTSRIPLRRCEAAFVRCRENGRRLGWVISPDSTKLISQLQDKVKSKMDTAKVFGAFLTAFTGLAIAQLVDAEPEDGFALVGAAGVSLLALGVLCYMTTMFLYDSLLMPTAQWPSYREPEKSGWWQAAARKATAYVGTGQSPTRPPSSAATVIFHSMQRVWGGLFVPATGAAGLGAALVAVALVEPEGGEWIGVVLAAVLIIGAATALTVVARPRFGSND